MKNEYFKGTVSNYLIKFSGLNGKQLEQIASAKYDGEYPELIFEFMENSSLKNFVEKQQSQDFYSAIEFFYDDYKEYGYCNPYRSHILAVIILSALQRCDLDKFPAGTIFDFICFCKKNFILWE